MFFFLSSIVLKNVFFLITPKSMSKLYNIGFLLGMFWILQLYTGVCLSFLYANISDFMGYFEIINATTDAENRLTIRYMHISGTSAVFFLIYIHMYKIFSSSVGEQRANLVFFIGIILYFLLVCIAFIGYVTPLTSMSYWGLCVFSQILASIPLLGSKILLFFWGGEYINDFTISKVFSLHVFTPMLSLLLIITHLIVLHSMISSDIFDRYTFYNERLFFSWNSLLRDIFLLLFLSNLFFYAIYIWYYFVFHEESFYFLSTTSTPEKIIPEWFFLTFFGFIKCIPFKFPGMIVLIISLLLIFTSHLIGIFSGFYSMKLSYNKDILHLAIILSIIGLCSTAVNLTFPILETLRVSVISIILYFTCKVS